MSNVVAFKRNPSQKPAAHAQGAKSMTLFIHIKRATFIAHCGDLNATKTPAQGRIGDSRI